VVIAKKQHSRYRNSKLAKVAFETAGVSDGGYEEGRPAHRENAANVAGILPTLPRQD
jgi:hypothetical protein